MINQIKILSDSISTMMETSKCTSSGTVMTESQLCVVNFDDVKKSYIKKLSVPEMPKSSDALFTDKKGGMYLIEFKNGVMDTEKIYAVRLKIFDSLLILTDILEKGVSTTRQSLNYILVYNENKNPLKKENDEVQNSKSKRQIKKHYLAKGKKRLIEWSLARFEGLYFKNVYTITKDEFQSDFVNKWEAI